MKKVKDFLKKYKIYILSVALVFFFFKSCSKSGDINKQQKISEQQTFVVDSLSQKINSLSQKIDSIPEVIRVEKINIHLEYDNWISSKDRGSQLMELHSLVKNSIKDLQK
tara:strand:- start:332 stop:661 length:330 start_codon:yes stop_codon:yes gene_type:complete